MKTEYKGFLVYYDEYYIEISEIDTSKEYEFKSGRIVEKKESNRKSYTLKKYFSNGTVYDAIDIYDANKDKELPRPAHSLVFDFWFDELGRNADSFHKAFGTDRLDVRSFFEFESCLDFWREFRYKDEKMTEFLTDDKIKEFWDIQQETTLIKRCRNKQLEWLTLK